MRHIRSLLEIAIYLSLAFAVSACTGDIVDPVKRIEGSEEGAEDEQPDEDYLPGPDGTVDPEACVDAPVLPGPSPIRRLTREEYDHTVQDLLGTSLRPAESFPPDDEQLGFTNNAEIQTVSPLLAEHYESAADALAREAVQDLEALLGCDPYTEDDVTCVEEFVVDFGLRAWRRPLTQGEVTRLVGFYQQNRDSWDIDDGVRLMVQVMLMSPHFLYRVELGGASPSSEGAVKLDDYQVATRLSYLIRGTTPAPDLLQLAALGQLSTPEEVGAVARQMLSDTDDPDVRRAVSEFHNQWLGLDRLLNLEKNREHFPEWTDEMGPRMWTEVDAFIHGVVLEGDGTLETLLTSDTTWIDPELADYYGYAGLSGAGEGVHKVVLPERAGLLTQPALLSLLADENQGSPIRRGIFVREHLFCEILSAPPPEVDDTPPAVDPNATTRERFAQHTEDAACAGCHSQIDPIGFGFENWDATGRYRETENGLPIDVSGYIAGTDVEGEFHGTEELAGAVASSEQVKACIVKHWFRYGYGRKETSLDACTMQWLERTFIEKDGNIRELIVALTMTDAFLYRHAGGWSQTPSTGVTP